MELIVTLSGNILFWDGPDTTYKVYGFDEFDPRIEYAFNKAAHSTKIWSLSTAYYPNELTHFGVSTMDLTVNGYLYYSLGRLTYAGSVITAFTGINIIVPERNYDYGVMEDFVITSFGTVFQGSAIQTLTFDANSQIASIDVSAFSDSSLNSITIPRNVSSIGSSAFQNCISLNNVIFNTGSKCTTIGANAFNGSNISILTIPRSVSRIGSSAMNGCTSLSKIIFEGLPPSYDTSIYNLTGANGFYYYRYVSYWPIIYDTIPMYAIPDKLTLNGSTLSWTGPIDVSYNVYVEGVLRLQEITGLSTNISSQIQYGSRFQVSAVKNSVESPLSNTLFIIANSGSNDCMIAKKDSNGNVQWATRIAGSGNDTGTTITTDVFNNVMVTGFYSSNITLYNEDGSSGALLSFIGGAFDCFIAKYSPYGIVQWAAQIAGSSSDLGFGIATDSNNNILATGYYTSNPLTVYNADGSSFPQTLPNSGSNDCFIAKYGSDGTVLWAARIGGGLDDRGNSIVVDVENNILVSGYFNSITLTLYNADGSSFPQTLPRSNSYECFIAKYSSDGTVLWAARIAGSGNNDLGFGISTDSNNNVLATGYYLSNPLIVYNADGSSFPQTLPNSGSNDCFIAKYGSNGTVLWATRIAGAGDDRGIGIVTDTANNIIISGSYSNTLTIYNADGSSFPQTLSNTGTDGFVVKYNSDGTVLWAIRIGGSGSDTGYSIDTDAENNILVCGYSSSNPLIAYDVNNTLGLLLANAASNDGFNIKYDSSGIVLWAARAAYENLFRGKGIASDTGNNILVSGTYASSSLAIYNAVYSYTPTNLSLNGTLLSWYGPSDASYNVYVAGVLRLSGITGFSVDISSQFQYGFQIYVTAVANGLETLPSSTFVVTPTDLSLNGTLLSWSGPSVVSYNVYVAGVLRLPGITGFSVDISDQLQYGIHFYVTAAADSVESPPSNTVVSSILRAPTDLSLNGTLLSWTGPTDVSYNVYVADVLRLPGITGLSVDIFDQLQYGIHFYVTAVANSVESTPSNTVVSSILPSPTDISLNGTLLSWSGPADVSYNVYVAGVLRLPGITGFSVDISDQLQYGIHFYVTAAANSAESPPSNTVVSSILPTPTDISLNGTLLSWSGPADVSYNVYVADVLRLPGIPGFSVDISSQIQYGTTFSVTAMYNGIESQLSSQVTYIPPSPSPTPTPKSKQQSAKSLRAANFFYSSSARTRIVAGREVIRSIQSSSKRPTLYPDALTQVIAAQNYIRGK